MIKIKSCALFGGTFDPIHNGHLHLINYLLETKKFDSLVVIPAGNPSQKSSTASAEDRLAMVALALKSSPVLVSDCEIRRVGPSYAIDTIREIKELIPADRYTWIIGSDAFSALPSWNRFDQLSELVDFLVIVRPGSGEVKPIPGVRFESIEIDALDISSTEVRTRVLNQVEISDLVPASVASYIREKGLYGAA